MTGLPENVIDTIMCGDCLQVMRDWPDKCVDLVCTDPPYGVNLGNHEGAKETRRGLLIRHGGYDDGLDYFSQCVVPAVRSALRVSHRSMVFGVPPGIWEYPAPDAIGGVFVAAAVGRNRWGWSNLIHCLLYGIAPDLQLGAKPTAKASTATAEITGHPTTKPLEWMLWAVELGSRPGDLILDPFCGSGTTCVAAKMLGRHYIGIDISPQYCEIARERLRAIDTGVPVAEARAGQRGLFEGQP